MPTRTHTDTVFTHTVFNQPEPLVDFNLFSTDLALTDGLRRHDASWAYDRAFNFGERMGSAEVQQWADQANKNTPVLRTFDRFGHRIDEVEFHPAWHQLMSLSMEYGLHNFPWTTKRSGAHVARAVLLFLAFQTEAGHCCPISMTYSVVPALRAQPELFEHWQSRIFGNEYDGRLINSVQKSAVTFGMAMTEKQGGSDVRANTTIAVADTKRGSGQRYRLTGHKWFCSAPMCDAFLVLAQAPDGLSCFLVPRILEDGSRNNFFIQRLKDKLGNRSNASSEVEFRDTVGYLVGKEGRGVPTIIEMVNHTRLDCVIGSAGLIRQATLQAVHHCYQRSAFGKRLVDQPLMKNVLADLAVESEAATMLMLRLAAAYDSSTSEEEQSFRRIVSAIAKYWLCKRAPQHAAEALECLGGAGYVEESVMPRLFRESPLNSIWEGSGNVISLDVLRAVGKESAVVDAISTELRLAEGSDKTYDTFAEAVIDELVKVKAALSSTSSTIENQSRVLVEKVAIALQGSLLLRFGLPAHAEAFVLTRLQREHGYCVGTLPSHIDFDAIIDRVVPS